MKYEETPFGTKIIGLKDAIKSMEDEHKCTQERSMINLIPS
jgi:hypothetical protein